MFDVPFKKSKRIFKVVKVIDIFKNIYYEQFTEENKMFIKKRKILLMHSEIILNGNNFKSHFKHAVNCSSIIFKVERGAEETLDRWLSG